MSPAPWHSGNALAESDENRSWLVGHFKPADDIRFTEDIEVKFSAHAAGDSRPEWAPGDRRRTLVLLAAGRHGVRLALEGHGNGGQGGPTYLLAEPGDYVVFGPGVAHSHWTEEDSTVITVRWPSIP